MNNCFICGGFFKSIKGKTYCNKHDALEAISLQNKKQYRQWRPIKKVKCIICGRLFYKIYKRNCCSDKCRAQNKLNITIKWQKENIKR